MAAWVWALTGGKRPPVRVWGKAEGVITREGWGWGGAGGTFAQRRKRTRGRFPWGGTRPGEDQTGRTPGEPGAAFLAETSSAQEAGRAAIPQGTLGASSGGGAPGQRRGRGVTRGGGGRPPGQPARARSARAGRAQVWEGSGRQMAPLGQTGTTSPRELALARFPNPSLSPTLRVGSHLVATFPVFPLIPVSSRAPSLH